MVKNDLVNVVRRLHLLHPYWAVCNGRLTFSVTAYCCGTEDGLGDRAKAESITVGATCSFSEWEGGNCGLIEDKTISEVMH